MLEMNIDIFAHDSIKEINCKYEAEQRIHGLRAWIFECMAKDGLRLPPMDEKYLLLAHVLL